MTSLPDWLAERVALDEVPDAMKRRRDSADPEALAHAVAAVTTANAAELADHPPEPAVAQITARADSARRARATARRRTIVATSCALAAAAVVVVLALPHGAAPADAPRDAGAGTERIKGTVRLLAFRQVGDQSEQLAEDAVVRAGDRLQLRYNGGGHGHGVIASIDGAGGVTLHFPASPEASTALGASTQTLPTSYELDDAPELERFFFLTADAPLDVAQALSALRALAGRDDRATAEPDLAPGIGVWSLRLRKAPTR